MEAMRNESTEVQNDTVLMAHENYRHWPVPSKYWAQWLDKKATRSFWAIDGPFNNVLHMAQLLIALNDCKTMEIDYFNR